MLRHLGEREACRPPEGTRTLTTTSEPDRVRLSRRQFVRKVTEGTVLGTLLAGVPKGWVGAAYASDGEYAAGLLGMDWDDVERRFGAAGND